MRMIHSGVLNAWAESKCAESRLPLLVTKLIAAVVKPDKTRIPSGDAVWLSGVDGYVECSEGHRFVPSGCSVWEMSTSKDTKSKADADFRKRSDSSEWNHFGIDRSQLTFVFVTPRTWQGREKWVQERKSEKIWKDVRALDGVDLTDWLECAPALNLQFAAELGLVPPHGLQTPENAWQNWAALSNPPTSEELVVAGREKQEAELIRRLLDQPDGFAVQAVSPSEAFGFILAALRRVEPEELRQALMSRTLIADGARCIENLGNIENQIVVLRHGRDRISGRLLDRGCHIIVPEGNEIRSSRNVIVLDRPPRGQFISALKRMNMSDSDAEKAARESGLNVTVFQRQRHCINLSIPEWAKPPIVSALLPAVLAGQWDSSNQKDREILCLLAGLDDYTRVEDQLNEFLIIDEPPLQKVGNVWALSAPTDAFQLTAQRLTKNHLDRFENAFQTVLGTIDGRVNIPPDEWLSYGVTGEKGYSKWLRHGLAETLLLIAERGLDAGMVCVQFTQVYVEKVVKGLPGLLDDWRVLASIRDSYPMLIEAAPRPFLDNLHNLIENRPDDVRLLFSDQQHMIGAEGMHTGLLWGLELLAWSPEYLTEVALILARLASIDPGGVLHNRPINSFREIFLWWNPGTNANTKQCLQALDLILERDPDMGWDLLEQLLPTFSNSTSSQTAKPRWKDFGDLADDMKTYGGQIEYMLAIVDRALDHAGTDSNRWQKILESQRSLAPVQQQRTLELLEQIAQVESSAEDDSALWDVVRQFVYKHRTYHYTDWALREPLITQLGGIADKLAPNDVVRRHRWLFDEWLPNIPNSKSDRHDTEYHLEEVKRLRNEAVDTILQTEGVKGLVGLGTTCAYPQFVASASTKRLSSAEEAFGFVQEAILAGRRGITLAGYISRDAMIRFGEQWRNIIMTEALEATWPPSVAATLFLYWPDGLNTWQDIVSLGDEVAVEYWKRKPIGTVKGSQEERIYAIERIIEAKRAKEMFPCVAYQAEGLPTQTFVDIFDATLNELKEIRTEEEARKVTLDSHDISEYLKQLRARADMPREALAVCEYKVLPLLGSMYSKELTIHEFMAEDPSFFVSVICDVYRPSNRDENDRRILTSEEKQLSEAKARAGFRLLYGMQVIPGRDEHGDINETELLEWVNEARRLASEKDRAIVSDQIIGSILAHVKEDPEDKAWPHLAVRRVIDELAASEIEQGIYMGRFNMRGVYSKALYEGGNQERELEQQYRRWAEASRSRWPRTAALMDRIAEGWHREAVREDEEAEQERLEF